MAGAGGEKEAALDQQSGWLQAEKEQQDIQAKVATSVADDWSCQGNRADRWRMSPVSPSCLARPDGAG